jgi:hypothetical protein
MLVPGFTYLLLQGNLVAFLFVIFICARWPDQIRDAPTKQDVHISDLDVFWQRL